MRRILLTFILIFLALAIAMPHPKAQEFTLQDLLEKVRTQQLKIRTMKANMTTTITSNIQGKEIKMTQKGRIWSKGTDKSKNSKEIILEEP